MKLAKKAATAASAALAEVAISTTEPAAPPPVVVYGCITIQPREINGAPNPDVVHDLGSEGQMGRA